MKQHYIPKFYFSPWINDEGHLYRHGLQRDQLISNKKTPTQICYQRNINTLNDEIFPEMKHFLEDWFTREIDNKAPAVLEKLIREKNVSNALNGSEYAVLANFVISLIIRRPESMEMLVKEGPDTLRQYVEVEDKKLLSEDVFNLTPRLQEYANAELPGLIENSGRLLAPEIIVNGDWRDALLARQWRVADHSQYLSTVGSLITCDRLPVCLGLSYSDPNSLIVLPISPHRVIYISSPERNAEERESGDGILALATNKAMAACCTRFVFSNDRANKNVIERVLRSRSQAQNKVILEI